MRQIKCMYRAIILIFSCLLFYLAIGSIFFYFALNTTSTQSRTIGEQNYVPSSLIDPSLNKAERKKDRLFLQETPPTTLTIRSHDSLRLQAYIYKHKQPTNRWIFAVHGYTGSAQQMTRWNRQLYELGYNILTMDLRGHGASEGLYYGMGWLDQPDLQQWLQLLIEKEPEAQITLYGVSMGGSAVLNLASSQLPKNVQHVIADSAFTSVDAIFEEQVEAYLHILAKPVVHAGNFIASTKIGLNFYEASTLARVPFIEIPIFFIHGSADTFVPVSHAYALYDASSSPAELWVIEEANHADGVKIDPITYRKRLQNFIDTH